MTRHGVRSASATLATGFTLLCSPAAWAVDPPAVDDAVSPPGGSTGPAVPMAQRGECVTTGLIPGTDPAVVPPAQHMLNLEGAWQFSRGEGQTVAVIDTGVRPGARLPNVIAGGDYVADADGLTDCDGHGTMVAGIIGAQPGADGFSGVAPGARLISIRHTSSRFAPRAPGEDPVVTRSAIDIESLARAVVHAADLGARVINISSTVCLPRDNTVDQAGLGAALRYASVDKDAVIVAAAGNAGPAALSGGTACQSNPAGWNEVSSVSVPSWWQPYVLSVGSVAADGQPSEFTMSGPWLGLAGPGENVVSLGNGTDGLADGVPDHRGRLSPVNGTSFAAAYVSGVAALVRSRFPELTAAQVVERLTATAHNGARAPSDLVGAGTVDPVAALTWQLDVPAPRASSTRIAAPEPPPTENHAPRTAAFAGTAVLALAVAMIAFVTHRRKGSRQ